MSKTVKNLISVLTLLMFLFLSNVAFASAVFQKLGMENNSEADYESIVVMDDDKDDKDDKDDDDKDDDDKK